MAVVGQQLLAPESGWRRFDNTYSKIEYSPLFSSDSDVDYYSKTRNTARVANETAKFNFTGKKLRIIGARNTADSSKITIHIDGVLYEYSAVSSSYIPQALVFEIDSLSDTEHYVVIKNHEAKACTIDAIDVGENKEIKKYNEDVFPFRKRLALKNPTTNQHYSLAEKTLIPLPDTSDKNMLLHGLVAGKEIQLDEPFDKIQYPVEIDEANRNADGLIVGYKNTIEKPLSIKFE